MRIVTMRHATRIVLSAALVFATCAVVAATNTEPVTAKFNLPYEVYWGERVLPAGTYTFSMESPWGIGLVRSTNGKTVGFTPIPIKNYIEKGRPELLITLRGKQRVVSSLNLPGSGVSLTYRTITSAEREMLTKAGQIDVLPVTTSRK